jgi:hypothetical protein
MLAIIQADPEDRDGSQGREKFGNVCSLVCYFRFIEDIASQLEGLSGDIQRAVFDLADLILVANNFHLLLGGFDG